MKARKKGQLRKQENKGNIRRYKNIRGVPIDRGIVCESTTAHDFPLCFSQPHVFPMEFIIGQDPVVTIMPVEE